MTGPRSYRLLPPKHRYRFRAGEKARCMGTSAWLSAVDLSPSKEAKQPLAGEVYVVASVRPFDDGRQMLALHGVGGHWCASSFRPVIESNAKTDISALTALLQPACRRKETSNA